MLSNNFTASPSIELRPLMLCAFLLLSKEQTCSLQQDLPAPLDFIPYLSHSPYSMAEAQAGPRGATLDPLGLVLVRSGCTCV